MTIAPDIALEGALNTLLSTQLSSVQVSSGSEAPQESDYPIVLIEQVIPIYTATFGNARKSRCYHYQIRCITTQREDALALRHQVDEIIMNALPTLTLADGWAITQCAASGGIPTQSDTDAAGIMYTQAGNEYEFEIQ